MTVRDIGSWRIAGMIAGLLITTTALAAFQLGLGKGEHFLLYRLCLVSRTAMGWFGVALTLSCLFRDPLVALLRRAGVMARRCWIVIGSWFPKAARAVGRRLERLGAGVAAGASLLWNGLRREANAVGAAYREDLRSGASASIPGGRVALILAGQALLVGVVTGAAFWIVRNDLLGYIDGHIWLTLIQNQEMLSGGMPALSPNPLEGLGDTWPFNFRFMPEFLLAGLWDNADYIKVAIHTTAAMELFLLVAGLSWWLEKSPVKASAAGWLAVILICPISYPALTFNIFMDLPQILSYIALPLLIVPVWAGLGRGTLTADLFRVGLIAAMLWLHLLTIRLLTLYTYPFLGLFCAVFLVGLRPGGSEFKRKLGGAVALLLSLLASGYFTLLYAMVGDTAFMFYADELKRVEHSWGDGSWLFRTVEPVGVVVTALALIGALVRLRSGRADVRRPALAFLIVFGGIATATLVWAHASWVGAPPIYYEQVLWALHPIFAVFLIAPLVATLWNRWSPVSLRHARSGWLVLPVLAILAFQGPNVWLRGNHNNRLGVYPPTPSVLTDDLRDKLGLAVGTPFRGRVATMTGHFCPPDVDAKTVGWPIDRTLVAMVGNDHRGPGLWYYRIPTLHEANHLIKPLFSALVRRYLVRPGDTQDHGTPTLSFANVRILRLLGVSHLISDAPEPVAGVRRLREIALPPTEGILGHTLALDEIPRPNLGLSPTETVPLGSGAEALEWLGREDTDLERRAILAGPAPGELVPARALRITIVQDGFRIQAESAGRSLVVIPFQYSHCWEAIPREGMSLPDLRRADLILTGLVFEGGLDTTLQYRLRPFHGGGCLLKDLEDSKALMTLLR